MSTIEDLKMIRLALGWSQKKMSDYIGRSSYRTLQDWERRVKNPPSGQVDLVIRLLIAEGVVTKQQIEDIIAKDHS